MKTLLVKDYRILLTNKKSIFFILILGVLMVISNLEIDFLIGYMMMFSLILSAGTINYDELDNGMSFLMTLPASRKTYAIEKYVLTLINALLCGAAIFVLYLITKGFVNWGFAIGEMAGITLGWVAGIGLSASFVLPMYMKFSAEKRRVVMIVFAGAIALLVYGVDSLINNMAGDGVQNGGQVVIGDIITGIEMMNPVVMLLSILVIAVAVIGISMLISIRIMKKKEF